MSTYTVHIRTRGTRSWATRAVEADTFPEAAVVAVTQRNKDGGLDLDSIPHAVTYRAPRYQGDYGAVVFTEASARPVFPNPFNPGGMTRPGEYWFSESVREGEPDDCRSCGGTGVGANSVHQCGVCGDPTVKVGWVSVGTHDGVPCYISDPAQAGSGKAPVGGAA